MKEMKKWFHVCLNTYLNSMATLIKKSYAIFHTLNQIIKNYCVGRKKWEIFALINWKKEKSLVFAQQSAKQLGKPLGWFIRKKDEYDLEFEKLMNSYIKLYSEYHKELILEKVEELQCKINTASSRGIRKIYHKQKQDLLKQIENL